jgi:signal transduction histidine kinase
MSGPPTTGTYRLTRNFAIGALVVMVVAALGLAQVHRSLALDQLQRIVQQNHASLTQTVANSFWPRHSSFIASAHQLDADEVCRHPRTLALMKEMRSLLAGTKVLRVKLYDTHGLTVFSTDLLQIGRDRSTDPDLRSAVNGEAVSDLAFHDWFLALDGLITNRWLLSSHIPIRPPGNSDEVSGVAEIYSDVSDFHGYARHVQIVETALVGAAFLIIFVLLLAVVWHADVKIRRQHRQKLQLAASVARAESADRAKSEFLGNMSHELRTPLNAIIGFSEAIRNSTFGPVGDPRYVEYSSDIHNSGRHLLNIINDVLDLARAESGKMPLARRPVDVIETARDSLGLLRQEAERAQVELRFEACCDSHTTNDDASKIRQVLINLLANALKFTPAGGSITLTIEEDARARMLRLIVADTGVGMRTEDIPVALAPFSQVDGSLTRQHEGTGLGLPLSRKLARLLGGDLALESAPGVGTTVTFTLPNRDCGHKSEPKPSAA